MANFHAIETALSRYRAYAKSIAESGVKMETESPIIDWRDIFRTTLNI